MLQATRFADISPLAGLLILCTLMLLIICGVLIDPQLSDGVTGNEAKDVDLYRAIVERMRAGDNYYEAAGHELRSRGYATRPFFNWRPPLLACFLAILPDYNDAKWILIFLALMTLHIWFMTFMKSHGFHAALLGGILLVGPICCTFIDVSLFFHEMWAGTLISMSLASYSQQKKLLSYLSGFIALGIRELSLLYVLTMMLMACREKQWREAVTWSLGLITFSIFLFYHAMTVAGLIYDSDVYSETWIKCGGWAFVMQTAVWNVFLAAAPQWLIALVLPLVAIGLVGWIGSIGIRVATTIFSYWAAFLIIGRPDNFYWGLMYAPLMPMGFFYSYRALADLAASLRKNT